MAYLFSTLLYNGALILLLKYLLSTYFTLQILNIPICLTGSVTMFAPFPSVNLLLAFTVTIFYYVKNQSIDGGAGYSKIEELQVLNA